MKHRCGWLVPLFMVLLGLSACESWLPVAHATPTPGSSRSATPTPDAQRCARLAKRGFTPCPPTAEQLTLPATTIRNATGGAISDATAQKWGRAFQLAQAYYYWVLENNARAALTSGVLSDSSPQAVNNLFGSDLMDLDNAKAAGGKLLYQPPLTPLTQIVLVPSSLQDSMRRQGLTPAATGLAVRFTGPTRRSIQSPNGTESVVVSRDAGYVVTGLIWGEIRDDQDLGVIWFEHGNYGCDGVVGSVCQL
jgi:hypothetical protein